MKNMLPSDKQERAIYAHLKSGYVEISATDWMAAPQYLPQYGNIFAIFILGEDYEEIKQVFEKLSEGCREDRFQALHQLPIGTYGQLYDKYGYQWIFKGDPVKAS